MVALPSKLRKDPVVEALLEVRFDSAELEEVLIGKLASIATWKSFPSSRLPVADIPAPLRQVDPNLKFQPLLERRSPDGTRVIKIGANVFSYHTLRPYPGWEVFEFELSSTLDCLVENTDGFAANRFGFRYINAFSPDHLVTGITQLNFEVALAGAPLDAPLNLNYLRTIGDQHQAVIRIASKEFVQNPAAELSALVDIDVFTPAGFNSTNSQEAKRWVAEAHILLKKEFFSLFTDELRERLVEE